MKNKMKDKKNGNIYKMTIIGLLIINIGAISYSVEMLYENAGLALVSGIFFWGFISLWLIKELAFTLNDIFGAFK